MNNKEFKNKHKLPLCTKNPLYNLIPYKERIETLRTIKQETIDAYGYDMEACPSRFTCNGECTGRELPWKSETAQPYLKKLAETHKISSQKLFVSKCDLCPIVSSCKALCPQINDYMSREYVKEPKMYYREDIENYSYPKINNLDYIKNLFDGLEIPWDYLTDIRKKTIELYVLEGRDFSHVAKLLGLYDQAAAKYEFYAGLTNLSRCAIMRKFLLENKAKLNSKQQTILTKLYFNNKTKTKVAEELNITKQAVQQIESRIIKNNNLKWEVFVKKIKGKVIYNTSELFR